MTEFESVIRPRGFWHLFFLVFTPLLRGGLCPTSSFNGG
ncbi:hypothetical protein HMPREF7215_1056 [Pyramidobacter piscolens W5455]|uniref:Uncharacterized protein n=1 Tax=Pyramidobacter piscolens W5455 TaxID=352165 RepID=A0ABP2HTW2_9BACT|nr:hypothetical protein HMPREF7215_1056 [Pyramidobacter piscolens W5455]